MARLDARPFWLDRDIRILDPPPFFDRRSKSRQISSDGPNSSILSPGSTEIDRDAPEPILSPFRAFLMMDCCEHRGTTVLFIFTTMGMMRSSIVELPPGEYISWISPDFIFHSVLINWSCPLHGTGLPASRLVHRLPALNPEEDCGAKHELSEATRGCGPF